MSGFVLCPECIGEKGRYAKDFSKLPPESAEWDDCEAWDDRILLENEYPNVWVNCDLCKGEGVYDKDLSKYYLHGGMHPLKRKWFKDQREKHKTLVSGYESRKKAVKNLLSWIDPVESSEISEMLEGVMIAGRHYAEFDKSQAECDKENDKINHILKDEETTSELNIIEQDKWWSKVVCGLQRIFKWR